MNKTKLLRALLLATLVHFIFCSALTVYAGESGNAVADNFSENTSDEEKDTIKDKDGNTLMDKDDATTIFDKMMGTGIWKDKANLSTGIALAQPVVIIAMILTVGIIVVAIYMFFLVTALDLLAFSAPALRPLLMGAKEKEMGGVGSGGKSSKHVISDCCYNLLSGNSQGGLSGSSGGMGSSGTDRGRSALFIAYAKDKSLELCSFIFFILLIVGGLLPKIAMLIYSLFCTVLTSIFSAIL